MSFEAQDQELDALYTCTAVALAQLLQCFRGKVASPVYRDIDSEETEHKA
jgi:hypothetical protein